MMEKAKKYAVYCLGKKNLTERELYDKLCDKGYEDCAAEVLALFVEKGLLCDRDYAFMYISDGVKLKYKGLYRLSAELLQKGVDKRIIAEIREDFTEDSYRSLLKYARVHYGEGNRFDRRTLEKIKAQFLRRGYSYDEIKSCFDELDWSEA